MKKIRILCYGDSNTWGFIPGTDHQRYSEKERWPKVLASILGSNYEIIEEGLNSRTLTSNDTRPGKEGRSGYQYLIPCLDSHDPLDLVIIMLGTNELKVAYNKTPIEVGELLEEYFVKTIINHKSQCGDTYPKLLIIAPPLIKETGKYRDEDNIYLGAPRKSLELDSIYQTIANKYNCYFLSNKGLDTGVDGVHLTKDSHRKLAKRISEIVIELNLNK